MVILTLVISILSLSITSLLVNVIGTELKTSISSLVDSSLGIARLDDEIKINEITSASFEDINMIKNKYPMLIDYIGTYYYSNFEEKMIDINQFYLDLNDYHYVINHMSLRSINDYIIDDNYSLNNDEIVLGIDSKTLYDISARLNISNDINVLKRYLINNNVEGVFSFINLSWEYYKANQFLDKYTIFNPFRHKRIEELYDSMLEHGITKVSGFQEIPPKDEINFMKRPYNWG